MPCKVLIIHTPVAQPSGGIRGSVSSTYRLEDPDLVPDLSECALKRKSYRVK